MMECHDAKRLLTFAQRKCEVLDAAERAALDRHLTSCPDCAAFATVEQRIDATFSKVMLDIPVPSDLSKKVLKRLAEQRPANPRKWLAVAAALLISASAVGVWHYSRPTEITVDHLIEFADFVEPFVGMPAESLDKYFSEQGIHAQAPPDFDYDYLRHVEVIEFRNRRVAKLLFRRELNNGVSAQAYVMILPRDQFHMDDLPNGQLNHVTTIEIRRDGEYTYVIYHRGNLDTLRRPKSAA